MATTVSRKKSVSPRQASPSAMPKKSFSSKEISFLRKNSEEVKPGLFLLYSTHS